MRRCGICGSISSDDERSCGVCGRSFSDASSPSLEQAAQISDPPLLLEKRVSRIGIMEMLSGIVLIVLGVLSLIAGPLRSMTFRLGLAVFPVALVLPLIGLFSMMVGISSVSSTSRPIIKQGFGRGGPMRTSSGSGWEHSYKEAGREKAEDHRKETGDAD